MFFQTATGKSENKLLLALVYRYWGVCMEKQGREQEALKAHQKGLEYALAINYIKGAALSHLHTSNRLRPLGVAEKQAGKRLTRDVFRPTSLKMASIGSGKARHCLMAGSIFASPNIFAYAHQDNS